MRSSVIAAAMIVIAGCSCGGKKHHAKRAKDATTTTTTTATHVVPPAPDAGAVAVVAGSGSGSGSGSGDDVVSGSFEACTKEAFADTITVPEASGSQIMSIDGADALVVISDSGNHGAYEIIDPATGAERESGKMPLGKSKSDDLEGLAARDGKLYGLTSSGFVLVWERVTSGWTLVDGPYAVADPSTGLSCKEKQVNCGKNYEGVCLRSGTIPDGECVGLAASKTDGALYCLTLTNGRLAAVDRKIAVCGKEALTGCDVAPDGSVWAGTNLFGGSEIYRVTGWTTPESATVTPIGPFGVGFSESIAVGPGDIVYRFSDLATAPSAVAKFHCPDAGR